VAWRDGFGAGGGAAKSSGDANADGDVDGADFLIWQQQLSSGGLQSPTGAPIPEPLALPQIGLALAAAAGLRSFRELNR
jgi:hypothetical protein